MLAKIFSRWFMSSLQANAAEYTALVAALTGAGLDDDILPSVVRLMELRTAGLVDNGTHLFAMRAAGTSQASLTALVEAALAGKHDLEPSVAAELQRMRRWSTFASLADADGNGDIDFGEFVTILTLLELGGPGGPGHQDRVELAFRTFDSDQSGVLEPTEARRMLAALAGSSSVGAQVRDRSPAAGELGRMDRARAALLSRMGADGGRLTLEQLRSFRGSVSAAVRRAEFDALDMDGSSSLGKKELATLLVSRVRPDEAQGLLSRAEALSDEAGGHGSTVSEMQALDALLEQADDLELALRAAAHAEGAAGSGVSREGFQRACRAVAGPSGLPTHQQEDVIFSLFDADGDGRVSSAELCGALRAASDRDLRHDRGSPLLHALARLPRCIVRSVVGRS